MQLFLLPGRIGFELFRVLAVKAFDIFSHVRVVRFPVVEMAEQQVVISASDLAEGNQVVWIKLQLRIEVKGFDMMNLYARTTVSTGPAGWLLLEVCSFQRRPFGTPGQSIFLRDLLSVVYGCRALALS